MMIKKVDTSFLGDAQGVKTSDFGAIWGSSYLSASQ